jgi:hypothetical protein
MMRNKAQAGINAAILVALIAGMIILYIVFLPAAERAAILDNKTVTGSTNSGTSSAGKVLLREFPGYVSSSRSLDTEKRIPNVFLIETTNAKELKRINPFIIRNSWLDKKFNSFTFSIDDPKNTDNVVLTFTTTKRQGVLAITLNNNVIMESELVTAIIEPISLDKGLLKDMNTLEFSVSSVSSKFWATNQYNFENVKIIGDITDTSRQESANIFTLSDAEYSNIDSATLNFIPLCNGVTDIGVLDIFVNNRKLFSSVPICDNFYRQDVPKSLLNQGQNNILFKTNKGSYSVEQIRVTHDFKDSRVKAYFFEITKEEYDDVRRSGNEVELSIKFSDSESRKTAKLDINGRIENLDTIKGTFSKNINSKVNEGNNFIRLDALNDLEVVELKVELK